MRIGLLHTSASNIPLFEAAALRLGLSGSALVHETRPDLLLAAQKAGYAAPWILDQTARALADLGADLDGVLLTCSTFGEAADEAERRLGRPVVSAEAALLRQALAAAGPVLALCAAPSTLEPTGRRLKAMAAEAGRAPPPLRLVEGAWARFLAGEAEGYRTSILAALAAARAEGFVRFALAQASMTPAATPGAAEILTSPEAGLRALLARL